MLKTKDGRTYSEVRRQLKKQKCRVVEEVRCKGGLRINYLQKCKHKKYIYVSPFVDKIEEVKMTKAKTIRLDETKEPVE